MWGRIVSNKFTYISLLFIILFSLILTSCEQPTTPVTTTKPATTSGPQSGGILRIGYGYDGDSIGYPAHIVKVYSNVECAPAVETLFRWDKSGELIPWLATGYKIDATAKTITLSLRKEVKFHDGTNFNADAVKWNLDQCIEHKIAGTSNYDSVTVVDDYTVRINLKNYDSTILSYLGEALGLMVSPTAVKTNSVEWAEKNPVGTGPFTFVSWTKDVKVVYKKFDGYWQKGKPYVNGIEWIIIADTTTREMSFKSGELDLLSSPRPESLPILEKEGFIIDRGFGPTGGVGLIPNSVDKESPFYDIRVRQAACYAVDSAAIVKSILSSEANVANQFNNNNWGSNPSVVGYPYNPTKAKQLLTEAGYPNGFKTKLTARKDPINDLVFTAAMGQLKAAGIDAEWQQVLSPAFDTMAIGGSWEGLLQNAMGASADVLLALVQRYIGPPTTKWFGKMLTPEDYVKALQNAVSATDFVSKQKYVWEAMKLMHDKYALMIPLYGARGNSARVKTLHDCTFNMTPSNTQWPPADAWLDQKK